MFFQVNICLNYTCIIFTFFNLCLHVFHVQFCCFHIGRCSTWNFRTFDKIDILFYEHHVQASVTSIYFEILVYFHLQKRNVFIFFKVGAVACPLCELVRDVMDVLVTCKNQEDPTKKEGARVLTTFSLL